LLSAVAPDDWREAGLLLPKTVFKQVRTSAFQRSLVYQARISIRDESAMTSVLICKKA
jgi:hypothetical protein